MDSKDEGLNRKIRRSINRKASNCSRRCPDLKPNRSFPSPNTCLPQEELEELKGNVEEANRFLLNLALGNREESELNSLQEVFMELMGETICVELNCVKENDAIADKHEFSGKWQIEGTIWLAGRDFVVLVKDEQKIALLYNKICKVDLLNEDDVCKEEILLNLTPNNRDRLARHFGEVVSCAPQLIQLFFKIRLNAFLLQLIDSNIKLVMEEEKIEGTLCRVDADSLEIIKDEGQGNRLMALEEICLFVFEME